MGERLHPVCGTEERDSQVKKSSTILFFTSFLIYQLPGPLVSQTDFFGYYETEMDQIRSRGTDYSFGYNKVRLDLSVSPLEEVTLLANLNYQLFHGQKTWDLFDFLPGHITAGLMTAGIGEFPFTLQDTLYLDNAYLRLSMGIFDVTVGKQQLSLGTGYAWNPLDIFNRRLFLDPTYEQFGINALRVELPLAERLLIDVIFSPGEDWNKSDRLILGKVGLGRFDITASAGRYVWSITQFDATTFQLSAINEKRQMIGGAVVGEVLQWGVWSEGSWISVENDRDYLEYVVGVDHTFDFSTYLLVEYYRNGGGIVRRNNLQVEDYLSYYTGETHSLMQDYLFTLLNHPVTDLLTFGIIGIANFNDGSAVFSAEIEYNLFENVHLTLGVSSSVGDENSEFGIQDWGMRLKLRAYF